MHDGGREENVLEKVAAIVVTYNRRELLRECVDALLGSNTAVDIIVVDNASTDHTGEMIKSYPADAGVSYINTGKNIGGAGGFQLGIRKAYEKGYDYFWLMDDDTTVRPDTLDKLMEADKTLGGGYGFLSSLALWVDGSECIMNYHTIAADWNTEKKKICEGLVKVEEATFVSFFTRREVVARAGLPLKEYFIWGDDTEYTRRISALYPCYLAAHSQVIHKMAANISSLGIADCTDVCRIERMFYSVRNDCCTYRRMGWKKFLRYTVNTFRMLLGVLFKAKQYKAKKAAVILKGYFAGTVFRPTIERVN